VVANVQAAEVLRPVGAGWPRPQQHANASIGRRQRTRFEGVRRRGFVQGGELARLNVPTVRM
jgi:hypothetical protein